MAQKVMRSPVSAGLAALMVALLCPARGSAQPAPSPLTTPAVAAGWTFAPALSFSGTWDDNALITSIGDNNISDYTTGINPRAEMSFSGRRGDLTAAYDGSFVGYRELNTLNTYDQRGSVTAKRRVTQRVTLAGRGSITSVPTTDLLELASVPFIRLGARVIDGRGSVETALNRRTSIEGAYTFQSVDFDEDPTQGFNLVGGHSHGGSFGLRHAISAKTTLTASYFLQQATELDGDNFTVQHTEGGAEFRLLRHTTISGAAGVARLGLSSFGPPRTGLALRAGLSHTLEAARLTVGYSRSFVPSYSFGGTSENEEFTGVAHVPVTRRVYAQTGFAWRRNQPLAIGELRLRSLWIDGALGYLVRPWMRAEGFYSTTRQTIEREDGRTNRTRIGFQVTVMKPLRIR